MKTLLGSFTSVCAIALVALTGGCTASSPQKQHTVRQRFVPSHDTRAPHSSQAGASWTALVPLNDGTGVSRLMAHAGIGDRFPVKDKEGRCYFEVKITGGDDDRLAVLVSSVEGSRRLELRRDESVRLKIGGSNFDLAYPSVSVSAAKGDNPTTSKAMLFVHRQL